MPKWREVEVLGLVIKFAVIYVAVPSFFGDYASVSFVHVSGTSG
jgi:hypothetical protein